MTDAPHPSKKPPPSGILALVAGALGIAFAPIFAKHAVNVDGLVDGRMLSPVAVAFWRMALAAPIFWALWLKRRAPGETVPRSPRLLLLPGLFFAADLGLWHWAFEYTSVANATLEANMAVVFVALVGWMKLKEKLTWPFALGAALAVGGTARLVGASFASGGDAWFGDLLGLASAIGYTGYLLSTKQLVGRHAVMLVMACTCTSCAVCLLVASLLLPQRVLPATGEAWASLVALALVAQIAGQGLIAFGMRRLPAAFSAVTLVIQPLAAAVLGWVLLGQALTVPQMVAGFVVLLGIYLARVGSRGQKDDTTRTSARPETC